MEIKFSEDIVPLTDLKTNPGRARETCSGVTPAGVAD